MNTSFRIQRILSFSVGRVALATLVIVSGGASLRADVVFAWNELLLYLATHTSESLPPPMEARVFALVHLAMDEAVASATSPGQSAETRINRQRAAVAAAAQGVLVRLLPSATRAIDALAARHLGVIADGDDKARGIAAGRFVAERVLERRADDRWVELAVFAATGAETAESADATVARALRGEAELRSPWLKAAPFGLKTAEQFKVREVRTFNRGSGVVVDFTVTSSRLFDQVDRAGAVEALDGCWAQRPIQAWNRVARQLSARSALDLPQQARLLAVLNVALADATLASLHWRHAVGTWRVMTADRWEPLHGMPPLSTDIVRPLADGNEGDLVRLEEQYVLIPPTPNYPAPSATLAGAAQATLTGFFKGDAMAFTLPPANPEIAEGVGASPSRSFASVSAAARESAYVASLNGRYSREACVAGYMLGESIGSYVSKRALAARR